MSSRFARIMQRVLAALMGTVALAYGAITLFVAVTAGVDGAVALAALVALLCAASCGLHLAQGGVPLRERAGPGAASLVAGILLVLALDALWGREAPVVPLVALTALIANALTLVAWRRRQ